jgi:dolichol-phosphate mannosyltransferase
MKPTLDIIIPVYNEGRNIAGVISGLKNYMHTRARVLIVYDDDDDDTIPVIANGIITSSGAVNPQLPIELVRNHGRGPHAAVMTGFAKSTAPFVMMFPADDVLNAPIIDMMMALARKGNDVVSASRFMLGGEMLGQDWLKSVIRRSANYTLHHVAGLPTTDATNGCRLFSRRVIEQIKVESTQGFSYGIELTVKAHRFGWKMADVPYVQIERSGRKSRFRMRKWLPAYLHWYGYAFATRINSYALSTASRGKHA